MPTPRPLRSVRDQAMSIQLNGVCGTSCLPSGSLAPCLGSTLHDAYTLRRSTVSLRLTARWVMKPVAEGIAFERSTSLIFANLSLMRRDRKKYSMGFPATKKERKTGWTCIRGPRSRHLTPTVLSYEYSTHIFCTGGDSVLGCNHATR